MAHSDESSLKAHEDNDIYSDESAGLDRVYHVKARLLNTAIQEIGMGKYQVRPPLSSTQQTILIRRLHPVDAVHSYRVWMVHR